MKKVVLVLSVLLAFTTGAVAVELRTGAQDSDPKFFMKDGKMVGLCYDVLKAVENIDPSIKFTGADIFLPFNRIETGVEEGSLDCFPGFIKNKEREALYRYIDIPIYMVRDVLVARKNDNVVINKLQDIKALKDNVILTPMGQAQSDTLKKEGYNVDDGGKNADANITKLLAGRGRFIFQSEISIKVAIAKYGVQDKVRVLPLKINESGRYFAFSKKTPLETIEKVRKAIEKLRDSGKLSKIFDKYVN